MLTSKQKEIRARTMLVLSCAEMLRIWVKAHKAVDVLSSPRLRLMSESEADRLHKDLDSNIEQSLNYLQGDLRTDD